MSQKATLNLDKLSFTDASSNIGELSFSSDAFTISKPVSFSNGISASNITVSSGGTISVSALSNLKLAGDTSGEITIKAADATTNYQIKMPDAQGAASTVLTNDGSGNLSWGVGGGGGANQALIWAIQGYVDLPSQPTNVANVPIDTLSNPGSTVYGGMTFQEYGASNRSGVVISVPTNGWYSIKFFYSHPALAIDGTGSQQGLGGDCKTYIRINGLNWEPFGAEDSAAGVSESSAVVMERYLLTNNTIQFGWEFGSSQPNEDFFISASLTNTQYVNSNDPIFTGATTLAAGTTGDVPQPLAGQQYSLLSGSGLWKTPNMSAIFDIYGTVNKDWSVPYNPTTQGGLTLSTAQWVTNIKNNYFIKLLNGPGQNSHISWNAGNYLNFKFEVYYKILNNNTPADVLGFYANANTGTPSDEFNTGGLIYFTDYYDGGNYNYKVSIYDGPTAIIVQNPSGNDDIYENFVKMTMMRLNNEIEVTIEGYPIGRATYRGTSVTSTAGTYFGVYGRTGTVSMDVEIKSIKLTVL